jgi:ubiquinone/menaquinone biosynthesis C-methylase UbiE
MRVQRVRNAPARGAHHDQQGERELAHWRAWQDEVDAVWGWQTPAGRIRAQRRGRLFRAKAHMTGDSSVLEVGCGTGEFTLLVAPHVRTLCATDLSPDLLRRAEDRVHYAGNDNVTFATQDVTRLTFASNSFDAVFGCSVLHHVDTHRALTEVHRVLKPGSWCVFSEPNMANPQIALQKKIGFVKRRMGDSPDETAFFRSALRKHFTEAGFEVVDARNFDFVHPRLPASSVRHAERIGRVLERLPGVRALSGSLLACGRKRSRV